MGRRRISFDVGGSGEIRFSDATARISETGVAATAVFFAEDRGRKRNRIRSRVGRGEIEIRATNFCALRRSGGRNFAIDFVPRQPCGGGDDLQFRGSGRLEAGGSGGDRGGVRAPLTEQSQYGSIFCDMMTLAGKAVVRNCLGRPLGFTHRWNGSGQGVTSTRCSRREKPHPL